MAAAGANMQDELLPELEMSIIPSKFTDNVKLDLFALDDDFINFLVERGCIDDDPNNDIQYMPLSKVANFCKVIRNMYKIFNAKVTRAYL